MTQPFTKCPAAHKEALLAYQAVMAKAEPGDQHRCAFSGRTTEELAAEGDTDVYTVLEALLYQADSAYIETYNAHVDPDWTPQKERQNWS